MSNRLIGNHGYESSDVVKFDLGPLLQGQTRIAKLKSAYNLLIISHLSVILPHEKSGWTFCPKTSKTFRTFLKNLGQNSCQSNFQSTGC